MRASKNPSREGGGGRGGGFLSLTVKFCYFCVCKCGYWLCCGLLVGLAGLFVVARPYTAYIQIDRLFLGPSMS